MPRPDLFDLRLIRLASECPHCGKPESRFVAEWRLDLYRGLDPNLVVETVRCSRCRGDPYTITVRAYQDASS